MRTTPISHVRAVVFAEALGLNPLQECEDDRWIGEGEQRTRVASEDRPDPGYALLEVESADERW